MSHLTVVPVVPATLHMPFRTVLQAQQHLLDVGTVLQAQQHLQLALSKLFEAQGYTGAATVGELADAWCESCRGLSPTTQRGYRHNLKSWAMAIGQLRVAREPHLAKDVPDEELVRLGRATPLAELEPALVERAVDLMAQGRWNSVTGTLRACLRWANGHGFAGTLILLPAKRAHRRKELTISGSAWARAAHAFYETFERARTAASRATAAAALCSVRWGVRRGAVARLEWAAIDGRELRLVDKRRARVIVLDELDLAILAALPRKGRFVFAGRGAGHVHPNSITALSRRVLRPLGLSLTLHQAGRHAAGVAILKRGGSTQDVAAHLGHGSDTITKKHYLPLAVANSGPGRALLGQAWNDGGER